MQYNESNIKNNEEILAGKDVEPEKKQKALKRLKFYEQAWGISTAANMRMYDMLLSKSANNLYKNRSASQTSTLQEQKATFEKLSVAEQIHVLGEILKLFKCASASADFKLLGKGSSCDTDN